MEAKALNIRLSEVFELALSAEVKSKRRQIWLRENANAIKKHNQQILEHGIFSEKIGQLSD